MPVWMKWTISLLVACGLIYIGWHVLPVLVTLHVIVCIILIIVIMLQSGSAADLAGAFGGAGSQTAFGPRGATTFLSRATTWCAIVFMMTSLALSIKRTPGEASGSFLENMSNPAPAKTPAPAPGKTTPPVTLPLQTPAPSSQVPAPTQTPTQTPAAPAPKQ